MNKHLLFSRYLLLLPVVFFFISLMLPGRYDMPYPYTPGPRFDPIVKKEYAQAISEHKPEVVLVGDSVLYFGIDQENLTRHLGTETYSMGIPGSASAVWYLSLKNMILEADTLPKYVVILFRDTMLTLPAFRTTGRYFELLDDFAKPHEPLLTELAFINQMNPVEKLAEEYFPLYSARWEIRTGLDSRIRYTVPALLLNCPESCADNALNSTFGKEGVDVVALNRAVADSQQSLYTTNALNFEAQINKSFLPEIIRMAQENNIKLIFVRTKTLTYPEYNSEPPALHDYTQRLKTYLSEQDKVFVLDFAHDARIRDSFFSDSLHFNGEGKAAFTKILADELRRLINQQ